MTDRSNRTNDTTENAFRACANCEAEFETESEYPVHTERDENGDLRIYSFCDYSCMQEWLQRPTSRRR